MLKHNLQAITRTRIALFFVGWADSGGSVHLSLHGWPRRAHSFFITGNLGVNVDRVLFRK